MGKVEKAQENKRKWIFAKKPAGKFYNYRQVVGYLLLAVLFVIPFIKIQGEPFLMFNVIDRKFVVFGQVFWPQDMHIFLFAMLIGMIMIVLFTAVFGRVWCGWTCPQTIFMELVFRKIEYWIEGDFNQQKKNNIKPWTPQVRFKKILKHSIFLLISFFISNIFLAYIIGIDALIQIVTDPIQNHIGGLVSIILFTLVFYFVFSYIREVVCTTICPYGRLQGVLMDNKSLNIAYDYNRGEPRGKLKKTLSDELKGDCVDCNLCVHVCPTGIDIRQGSQMECVNCTACIDACDAVMDKIGKPRRLIGFYSADELENNLKLKGKNIRSWAYSILLIVLSGAFFWLLLSRTVIDGTLLRATGTTFQTRDDNQITNLYSLELINKSNQDADFSIVPADETYSIQLVNHLDKLKKGENHKISLFLITDQSNIKSYKSDVKVNILVDGKVVETLKTTFIGPPLGGTMYHK